MSRSPQNRRSELPSAKAGAGPLEPVTARELAFACVREFDATGAYLADSLERLQLQPLSTADRALAMELSYTVLRRRMTIDLVLRQLVDRDPASVEGELWTVLQLGVVQVLLMPGLPVHAAVHETVELAKRLNSRWGGMVNGVLRSLLRLMTEENSQTATSAGVPLVTVRPAAEGESEARLEIAYRIMRREVFPDYSRDALGYIAAAFSMPRELIARWPNGWDAGATLRQAAWLTTPGVLSLRVNRLRTDRERLMKALKEVGAECWAGQLPESIRLAGTTRISRLPGFEEGWFSVQDESAMQIVDLLNPQPGETILDLCAAPGGKSTHAAERMKDEGTIIACDLSERRLRLVAQSSTRLGLNSVSTQAVTDHPDSLPQGPFDGAIVDAPCSNTGVLGKRPEARWRLSEADFVELPSLQLRLLSAAAERVKSGGRVVYSTCSIDALENEGVVREFLNTATGWTLERQHHSEAGRPGDGGFAAMFRRA